ncbi:predicted protein [Sclerotinia sclerotiorum 1980 UF-70]|uniref:Uncharacterized protein n=1 Tax=Sclerotinia sclerotiorum (strain ATCC 18683 / 1980 / Ss-1) TaxID=665079 RepID=A7EF88_SCLS1|nr:predicted protein [Sclerotinia sclerotiorum 1980 UF-70]EDO01504.1 predicted protein [Sclerotinia sclerotiorum 1980 UF-70]
MQLNPWKVEISDGGYPSAVEFGGEPRDFAIGISYREPFTWIVFPKGSNTHLRTTSLRLERQFWEQDATVGMMDIPFGVYTIFVFPSPMFRKRISEKDNTVTINPKRRSGCKSLPHWHGFRTTSSPDLCACMNLQLSWFQFLSLAYQRFAPELESVLKFERCLRIVDSDINGMMKKKTSNSWAKVQRECIVRDNTFIVQVQTSKTTHARSHLPIQFGIQIYSLSKTITAFTILHYNVRHTHAVCLPQILLEIGTGNPLPVTLTGFSEWKAGKLQYHPLQANGVKYMRSVQSVHTWYADVEYSTVHEYTKSRVKRPNVSEHTHYIDDGRRKCARALQSAQSPSPDLQVACMYTVRIGSFAHSHLIRTQADRFVVRLERLSGGRDRRTDYSASVIDSLASIEFVKT